MTYDQRCYDLGELFLEDVPHLNTKKRRDDLAQTIQAAIEGYIAYEQNNYEPKETGDAWTGGFADNH
jgi:hypothetical protein